MSFFLFFVIFVLSSKRCYIWPQRCLVLLDNAHFILLSSYIFKLKYYYNNSGVFFLLNIDINIDGKILQFLKVQSRFTFNQQNQVIDIIIFRLTLKCVMINTLIFKSDTVPSCHSVYYIVMILLNIYSQVYYLPVLRSPNSLYKCLSVCGVSL